MGISISSTVRSAMADAFETALGSSAKLLIYTGGIPASPGTAASGSTLATITLPADWLGAASSGQKTLSGTWTDASAELTGTAGYFRIYDYGLTFCGLQGLCATSTTADLQFDTVSVTSGLTVNVTAFTLTMPSS